MNPDWSDLQIAVAEHGQLLLPGIPSGSGALYIWAADDFAGWLASSRTVRASIVYATEILVAEHVDLVRERLNDLRDAAVDDEFDAEADQIDLRLAEIVQRTGDVVIGWVGEWRHDGIAHHYSAVDVPEELSEIDTRLEARAALKPSASERRALRSGDFAERREAALRAKQEQTDIAAVALSAEPDFPKCTNMAQRKLLLTKVEREQKLNLDGVNREEVIAAAKALLAPT
jgi:hypothetical protein